MRFVNAIKFLRKSGGAKPRDLQFRDLSWKRGIRCSNRVLISPAPFLVIGGVPAGVLAHSRQKTA